VAGRRVYPHWLHRFTLQDNGEYGREVFGGGTLRPGRTKSPGMVVGRAEMNNRRAEVARLAWNSAKLPAHAFSGKLSEPGPGEINSLQA